MSLPPGKFRPVRSPICDDQPVRVDILVGWDAIARQVGADDTRTAQSRLDDLGVPYARFGEGDRGTVFTTRRAIQEAIDRQLVGSADEFDRQAERVEKRLRRGCRRTETDPV